MRGRGGQDNNYERRTTSSSSFPGASCHPGGSKQAHTHTPPSLPTDADSSSIYDWKKRRKTTTTTTTTSRATSRRRATRTTRSIVPCKYVGSSTHASTRPSSGVNGGQTENCTPVYKGSRCSGSTGSRGVLRKTDHSGIDGVRLMVTSVGLLDLWRTRGNI